MQKRIIRTLLTVDIMIGVLKAACGGSVVECLARDRGVVGLSLTGVPAVCPSARHIMQSVLSTGLTQED